MLFYCMFIFATILYSETFNTPKGVALQIPLYQNNDNLIVIVILTTSKQMSIGVRNLEGSWKTWREPMQAKLMPVLRPFSAELGGGAWENSRRAASRGNP